jgi:hypothetical protein
MAFVSAAMLTLIGLGIQGFLGFVYIPRYSAKIASPPKLREH